MHWIQVFSNSFTQSAQAVRKHAHWPDKACLMELWRDLAGLMGLVVFVACWIVLLSHLDY